MFYTSSNLDIGDEVNDFICAVNMSGIAVIIVAKVNRSSMLVIII